MPKSKSFVCDLCEISCKSHKDLIFHFKTEHKEIDIKPLKCPFCDLRFSSASNLNRHTRSIHENKSRPTKKAKQSTKSGKESIQNETNQENKSKGNEKLVKEKNNEKDNENILVTKDKISLVQEEKQEKFCQVCDALNRHVASAHKKNKPEICELCNALKRHMAKVHYGKKRKLDVESQIQRKIKKEMIED